MNKHRSKASTAFSLIELSIAILIVGIIIAGITQSSRLVRQSKLKSAQNLTITSPVNRARSIALWLETTQDASFPASGLDDESPLLQWNDLNPQATSKFFAIPASGVTTTGTAAIKYDNDGINGLPSIKFDGTNTTAGILSLSTSATTLVASPVVTTADPNNVNAFTAFMVYKLEDPVAATDYTVLYNGVYNTNGWGYLRDKSNKKRTIQVGNTKPIATAALPATQEIATITYSGYNAANLSGTKTTYLYVNGGNGFATIVDNTNTGNNGQVTGTSATTVVAPTASMFIGGTTSATKAWKGLISEVIIFDTVLKKQDLKNVAQYLSKKYNIPLS